MKSEAVKLSRKKIKGLVPRRYKDGRARRAHVTAEQRRSQAPVLWHRLVDNAREGANNPLLESVIGKMSWDGILTDGEAVTANHIARVFGSHDRLFSIPHRHPKAPSYLRSTAGGQDKHKAETVAEYERRCRKAKADYNEIVGLIPPSPSLAMSIIEDVCVNDVHVNSAHHADIKQLLNRIGKRLGYIASGERSERERVAPPTLGDIDTIVDAAIEAFNSEIKANKIKVRMIETLDDPPNGFCAARIAGTTMDGKPYERTIRFRRHGFKQRIIEAKLLELSKSRLLLMRDWDK